MPANPDKTPCSHPGCRAWAMRGSDPPICSVHAGRPLDAAGDRQPGAQPGNNNALLHGFYSRFLRNAEGNPVDDAGGLSLTGEIAITRVALHRVLTMLVTGTALGARPRPLSSADLARLVCLAFASARTGAAASSKSITTSAATATVPSRQSSTRRSTSSPNNGASRSSPSVTPGASSR